MGGQSRWVINIKGWDVCLTEGWFAMKKEAVYLEWPKIAHV